MILKTGNAPDLLLCERAVQLAFNISLNKLC